MSQIKCKECGLEFNPANLFSVIMHQHNGQTISKNYVGRQVYNCHNGEMNVAIREIWCNKFREFCKFCDCNLK